MPENTEQPTTPRDTDDSSSPRRSSFRFSLSGLLVFMFGLGAGLSALRQPGIRWTDAVMTAFGAWLVVGLANQIYDFGATLRRYRSGVQTFGLIFSLAWRLVLIAGLLGFYALRVTANEALLWKEDDDYFVSLPRTMAAQGMWALILLASCFPGACFRGGEMKGWRIGFLNALGAIIGIGWCILGAGDRWVISFLVHAAIRNVENYQPLRRNGVDIYPANLDNELQVAFERGALTSICLTFVSVGLLVFMARFWNIVGRRWLSLIATLACLACQFSLLAWCGRTAVPQLSPFLAPSLLSRPWQTDLFGLIFIAFVSCLLSYLLSREKPPNPTETATTWRRRPRKYYHEHLLVVVLPVFALTAQTVEEFHGYLGWKNILWSLAYLPLNPTMMLHTALMVLVIRAAVRRWKGRDDLPQLRTAPLALGKFLTLWSLSFIATCFIAVSGSWFGFAFLLSMRKS